MVNAKSKISAKEKRLARAKDERLARGFGIFLAILDAAEKEGGTDEEKWDRAEKLCDSGVFRRKTTKNRRKTTKNAK